MILLCEHRWDRDNHSMDLVCSKCGKRVDMLQAMAMPHEVLKVVMAVSVITPRRFWEEMCPFDVDAALEAGDE